MATRTVGSTVSFVHRFVLAGVDGDLPPGNYAIETDEEMIEGVSFEAYRRVATYFLLPALGAAGTTKQMIPIQPSDLAEAQRADASAGSPPGA